MEECIREGSFAGRSLMCFRNEESKLTHAPSTSSVVEGTILQTICLYWDLDINFKGKYLTDNEQINNSLAQCVPENKRTAWLDKYTSSFYSVNDTECRRHELQPVPDILRWYKTGQLHYLPLEERSLLKGPWDDIPEALLPSKVLDLWSSLVIDLTDELVQQVSVLSWATLASSPGSLIFSNVAWVKRGSLVSNVTYVTS